jgi:hypothetical protein
MPLSPSENPPVTAPPRSDVRRRSILRIFLAALLACVAVFGIDALLFRTKMYPQLLEPDSSTGQFELTLRRELKAQRYYGDNLVVTLGDSRFGYSPRLADELTPQTGYVFRHAGMPGTDVRAWYYMLRDLDPTARRYRAVIFAVNDYDDEDWGIPENDPRLLHYAINRLRLSDVPDFFHSFQDRALQWDAFRGSILKGLVYQTDIQAFLANPKRRIHDVHQYNDNWGLWTWNYVEPERSMVGLQIDWKAWKVVFPPGADQNQRESVQDFLMYPTGEPQTGHFAAFRRKWFGRIIDRYRDSPTKIVFLRLARGPIPRPGNLVHKKSSSIRELARRRNVLLVPEHAFDSLEHPELFKDALHLNRDGSERFSVMLAEEIAKLLGPPTAREAAK